MWRARYRIVHRCRYALAGTAASCRLVARLAPLSLPHQVVELHQLVVRPLPASRESALDAFGNHCAQIELRGVIGTIDVTAISVVHMSEARIDDRDLAADWQSVAARTRAEAAADQELAALLASSPRASATEPIVRYARASFPPGRALGDALRDLLERLSRDFVFDTTATSVDTPLATFWEQRRGVCQDFTHATIACLRSLGLAARYASGYVRPPRAATCVSHAWAAIWLPRGGFLDIDPTLAKLGPQGHIALGHGRDYDDLAPLEGTAEGTRGARLDTKIVVSPE